MVGLEFRDQVIKVFIFTKPGFGQKKNHVFNFPGYPHNELTFEVTDPTYEKNFFK